MRWTIVVDPPLYKTRLIKYKNRNFPLHVYAIIFMETENICHCFGANHLLNVWPRSFRKFFCKYSFNCPISRIFRAVHLSKIHLFVKMSEKRSDHQRGVSFDRWLMQLSPFRIRIMIKITLNAVLRDRNALFQLPPEGKNEDDSLIVLLLNNFQ